MALRIDKVQLQFDIKPNYEAQQLNKLKEDLSQANGHLKELEENRKSIEKSKPKKSDTQAWAEYQKRLLDVNKEISQQRVVVDRATKAVEAQKEKMGLEALTLKELQNDLKRYNTILSNLTPGTEAFNETKRHIDEIKDRITELRGKTVEMVENTQGSLMKFVDDFNKIGFAITNFFSIKDKIVGMVKPLYDWLDPMAEIASQAEGIELAFQRLNKPGMLDSLRQATHDTVTDIELMKQAVKFQDFNLPVEQLGTYLAFAQQKAKDTGEDIDYLVTSIVNGLGRQSKPILDNLGISVLEINNEVKRTGNFVQAVTNIVERNMQQAGDYIETYSERAAQAETRLKNAQAELGQAWLPVKERIDETYGSLQLHVVNATRWLLQHREYVVALTAAMTTYATAVALYTAWQNRANISLELFNKLSRKNVIGLLAAGVAALVTWLITYRQRMDEARQAREALTEAEREGERSAAAEEARLRKLYEVTQDTTKSMDERLAAVEKIKAEYPAYFGQLSNETILAGQAAAQYRQLASDITAAAKARAYQKRIENLAEENLNIEDQIKAEEKWMQDNKGAYAEAWNKKREIGAGDGLLAKIVGKGAGGYTMNKYQQHQQNAARLRRQRNANDTQMGEYSDRILQAQPATARLANNPTQPHTIPENSTKSQKNPTKSQPAHTDPFSTDLATLEQNRREALNILKQSLIDGDTTEAEYQQQQNSQQMAYLQARLALEQKYGKDTTDTEGKILDTIIDETERKHRQQLQEERENDQERLQQRKQMLDDMQKAERQAVAGGDFAGAQFQNDLMYSLDLISFEQYEQQKTEIEKAEQQKRTEAEEQAEQQRQQIREAFAQQAQQLMQATSSLFSALQSREESRVDAKYKKLIAAAKKQGKDTTKLEEQQEAEKLAIQKKYADKQFAMTVLQIIAQTALGIQKIWAEWGWNPPVAIGMTATESAVGAVQLATAKAQRDQAAGLYKGGYNDEYAEGFTGSGNPEDEAGVIPVHKREFVINHEALQVPAVRRVADVIDSMQKRRAYSMRDTSAELQRAVNGSIGLAAGGYSQRETAPSATVEVPTTGRLEELMEQNNALLSELLGSGITILELRRKIRQQEQLERNASR